MDSISASEAARRLGSSLPRVMRAIERLGLDVQRGRGGRVRLRPDHLDRLAAELGVVPRIDGLSRVEIQVLAALQRAPRGLSSVRAVARRAGVAPSSASAAVATLERRGLVRRDQEWVAMGRARAVDVIRASVTASAWHDLAPHLTGVRPPVVASAPVETAVPARLAHLFWNAPVDRLSPHEDGAFIADRILASGDLDALAWGARTLRAADWERASRDPRRPAAERVLAQNLMRGAPG